MMEVLVTFIVTTAIYAVGLWMALRRVAVHLKDNEAGSKAVTEHVLLPILGKKEK
jgi:hypothetical protein